MSIYNFTDREHETTSNSLSGQNQANSRNGRLQTGYHQMENDFMNRNFTPAPNYTENTVQLTRPTSKTALLVRQRRGMLEQLSCFICKGYLIDASTIDECMDSFCKSCIVIHFRSKNNCPKCGTIIDKQFPLDSVRPDKVLQDIVYKLIPGLYDSEMKRRRDFYKNLFNAKSSYEDDDGDSSTDSIIVQGQSLIGEQYGVVTHPKLFYKPTDNIDLSIEPQTRGDHTTVYYDNKRQSIVTCFTGSIQQRDLNNDSRTSFSSVDGNLFKTYLRCPAKLTVMQLKKFIAAKFNICHDDTIHLLYLNESLKDEYSFMDVAYIYDWRGIQHMQLFYIIERDLTKVSAKEQEQNHNSRGSQVARQSVGISTQTVKRVCIDPQPKFYEETNNNDNIVNNFNGRSMRSRIETPAQIVKASLRTNPIIRTTNTSNNSERKSFSIQTNGLTTSHNQSLGQIKVVSRHIASINTAPGNHHSSQKVGSIESRSLRSQASPAKVTDSSLASQVSEVSQHQGAKSRTNHVGRNTNLEEQDNKSSAHVQTTTSSQLVPFTGTKIGASIAITTQSSMVTLASLTGSRNNNFITSISASSASLQSPNNNQQCFMQSSNASYKQPDLASALKNNHTSGIPQTPQLAFRFVTERGITIVRRLNNQDDMTNSNVNSNALESIPRSSQELCSASAQTTAPTINLPKAQTRPQSMSNIGLTSNNPTSCQSTQSTSSHRINDQINTPRHNLKVKPVYKTFVDPTKLKSPNFKKLGYTARH